MRYIEEEGSVYVSVDDVITALMTAADQNPRSSHVLLAVVKGFIAIKKKILA